jgi:hypothetical protein
VTSSTDVLSEDQPLQLQGSLKAQNAGATTFPFGIPANKSTPPVRLSKQCSKCRCTKPVEDFSLKRPALTGLARWDSRCKNCDSKQRKSVYLAKKQKVKNERKKKVVIDVENVEVCEYSANEPSSVVTVSDLLKNYMFNLMFSPR